MFAWGRIEILVNFPNKFVSDLLMLIAKKLTELGGHSAMKISGEERTLLKGRTICSLLHLPLRMISIEK